jgi:hypothetical protein
VGGALLRSKQMLNVSLRHDGCLPGTGACIECNVTVKVESQALTVVEINHQKSPPE